MIERQILARLIIDNDLYYSNHSVLSDNIFTDPKNRKIFEAIVSLLSEHKKADIVSITERSKVHLKDVTEIATNVNFSFDFNNSIDKLASKQQTTRLISLAVDFQTRLKDKEPPESIISFLEERLIKERENKNISIVPFAVKLQGLLEHIKRNKEHRGLTGVPTGLEKMDLMTGGLQKTDLIVIAGETSQGKTSLALTIGKNAAKKGKKIVFFSLEMGDVQLTARIMSQETEIPTKKMIVGELDTIEAQRLDNSVKLMNDKSIFIDQCSSTSLEYITDKIKIYKLRENIDLVVIDYLQLVSNEKRGASKEQQVGEVARRFKNLARQLNIPIILISQLSRDKSEQPPTLGRLRDSGQIEEAADVVIFVYRPEVYNKPTEFPEPFKDTPIEGNAMIMHSKGRNVGTGSYILRFSKRLTLFRNESDNTELPEPGF